MTIDWVVVGVVANALMAVGTFLMAWKTAHAVQLQREQLIYAYAPTFFVEREPGESGAWPDFRIRNRGYGPAYDAVIVLRRTSGNYAKRVKEIDYWPTEPVVQYDLNRPDSQKLDTAPILRELCAAVQHEASSLQELETDIEIVIFYSDHLHERYKAWCKVRISHDQVGNSCKVEFPNGRVFRTGHVCRGKEQGLLLTERGASGEN